MDTSILISIVEQIVPYFMENNTEHDAIDLMMEVDKLEYIKKVIKQVFLLTLSTSTATTFSGSSSTFRFARSFVLTRRKCSRTCGSPMTSPSS